MNLSKLTTQKRETDMEREWETCGYCEGEGGFINSESDDFEECPECDGHGEFEIEENLPSVFDIDPEDEEDLF